jgi:hypothetical protein
MYYATAGRYFQSNILYLTQVQTLPPSPNICHPLEQFSQSASSKPVDSRATLCINQARTSNSSSLRSCAALWGTCEAGVPEPQSAETIRSVSIHALRVQHVSLWLKERWRKRMHLIQIVDLRKLTLHLPHAMNCCHELLQVQEHEPVLLPTVWVRSSLDCPPCILHPHFGSSSLDCLSSLRWQTANSEIKMECEVLHRVSVQTLLVQPSYRLPSLLMCRPPSYSQQVLCPIGCQGVEELVAQRGCHLCNLKRGDSSHGSTR